MGVRSHTAAKLALEKLLDTILNADRVFSAEYLFSNFSAILPRTLSFDVILREERRFRKTKRDFDQPWLNFNFLSFTWDRGNLIRFKGMGEIDSRVDELIKSADHEIIEQHKLLCFAPVGCSLSAQEMIKAAARCLGCFYYTCGAHDHFTTNVAARFVRDYFKHHKRFVVGDIVDAVEKECKVRAAYLSGVSAADRLTVVSDPSGIYAELERDATFHADLQTSLLKKVTIIGESVSGFNYTIHTLTHEYFDHSRPLIETAGFETAGVERNFAYAPRGVVITAVKGDQLRLDVLSFTPRIFRAYVNDRIFGAREEFFYGLLRDGGKVVDRLLVEPAATALGLRERLYPLLEKACSVLVELTFASSVVIRAYDPHQSELVSVASWRQREINAPRAADTVSVNAPERFASVRAFLAHRVEGLDELESLPEISEDFDDSGGHVASIPIKVGAIQLGTLDFFTSDRKFFANDRKYLETAASAIGELIRRVEAANDSAWLSRLSFLHSARHRLERFRRNVAKAASHLGEELDAIVQLYSSLNNSPEPLTVTEFAENISAILYSHAVSQAEVDAFLAGVLPAFSNRHIPSLSLLLFQEVLDNLLHNAKVHSDVRLSDFTISHLGVPTQPPSAVMINYRANGAPQNVDVLSRLCISPIQERGTSSYHYGLFLLAAQLRMAGGYAAGRRMLADARSTAPFEVTFGIPLTESQ